MNKQDIIKEQIKASQSVARDAGWVAVITETKLTKRARKSVIGFRFEREESAEIGNVINNADGSLSEILAIA